mmetsp:Transcript_1206/g.1602  ORF Transcript_1206/g.1602 Transcript_1206/m.1602 type:complete len:291 (+) Transcript_1206:256-1128(+)
MRIKTIVIVKTRAIPCFNHATGPLLFPANLFLSFLGPLVRARSGAGEGGAALGAGTLPPPWGGATKFRNLLGLVGCTQTSPGPLKTHVGGFLPLEAFLPLPAPPPLSRLTSTVIPAVQATTWPSVTPFSLSAGTLCLLSPPMPASATWPRPCTFQHGARRAVKERIFSAGSTARQALLRKTSPCSGVSSSSSSSSSSSPPLPSSSPSQATSGASSASREALLGGLRFSLHMGFIGSGGGVAGCSNALSSPSPTLALPAVAVAENPSERQVVWGADTADPFSGNPRPGTGW